MKQSINPSFGGFSLGSCGLDVEECLQKLFDAVDGCAWVADAGAAAGSSGGEAESDSGIS